MNNEINPTYPIINDVDGTPLDAGFIFIGVVSKDPEQFPQQLYWNKEKTQLVIQPVRTRNGYIVNGSTRAKIYIEAISYSIRIKNKYKSNITNDLNHENIADSSAVNNAIAGSKVELTEYVDEQRNEINVELNKKASLEITEDLQLKKADKIYVDSAVGAISTDGSKQYATLALANADIANISLNKNVFVSEANNGGYWYKASSGATSLTKSPYDPVEQSKEIVDSLIEKTSPTDIFALEDENGNITLLQTENGDFYVPRLDLPVQDEISNIKQSVEQNVSANIREQKDNAGNIVEILDSKGHLHLPYLPASVQNMLLNSGTSNSASDAIKVVGNSYVGGMLTAIVKDGYAVDSYQWYRNNIIISGATSYTYTLTTTDMGSYISCEPVGLKVTSGNGIYVANNIDDNTIGGVALETVGSSGIYNGFKLSFGDDFKTLDVISPENPLGKWFTTRTYLGGTRATDSWLQTQYEVDPKWTGYKDSNRGVPLDFGNMTVKNSVLRMQCRNSTEFEKSHIEGRRKRIASLIDSIGACSWYAGDDADGQVIVECKVRLTPTNKNFRGFHPSFWTQSSTPSIAYDADEMDIIEGEYNRSEFNLVRWNAGAGITQQIKDGSTTLLHDGLWHTLSGLMSKSRYDKYIDGNLVKSQSVSSNTKNKLQRIMATSHVAEFDIVESDWLVDILGSNTYEVDFIRIWRKSAKSHIKPLINVPSININHGDTGEITLPSMTDLWGRTDLIEHVQTVMTEEIEPFGTARQAYDTFPVGVIYDSVTRKISIDTAQTTKSGRLNFVIYGYLADGSTCEPVRTYVNVSPVINVNNITLNSGGAFDLYAACDCGVLVTDGVKCTKVIDVSGLPEDIFYNKTTGYLQNVSAPTGSHTITVNCTNSVGQSTSKSITLTIS